MPTEHTYRLTLRWTGNLGSGTSDYRAYGRGHEVAAVDKPTLLGSSDPAFRGDPQRWNPEELLVASVAQCHMLWYLHLAAVAGVVVTDYADEPVGVMVEDGDGGGQFAHVLLRPRVTVTASDMVDRALAAHSDVAAKCFVARSVSFPIGHEAQIEVE